MAKCYTVKLNTTARNSQVLHGIPRPGLTNLFELDSGLISVSTDVYFAEDPAILCNRCIMAASVRRNECRTLGEFKLLLPDPADRWAIVMIEGPVTILQATDKVFTLASGRVGTVVHLAPGEAVKVIKGSPKKPGILNWLGLKKPEAPESFTITFHGDLVTIG